MELSLIIMVIGISLTLSTIVLLALIPFFSYFTNLRKSSLQAKKQEFQRFLEANEWQGSAQLFESRLQDILFLDCLYEAMQTSSMTLKSYLTTSAYTQVFNRIKHLVNHSTTLNRVKAYKLLVSNDELINLNELRYILKDFHSKESILAYWSSKLLLKYDFQEYSEKLYNHIIQNKSPLTQSLSQSLLKSTPPLLASEEQVTPPLVSPL